MAGLKCGTSNGRGGMMVNTLSALSGEREPVAAPHLSFPGIGHIAREGGAYRFVPIEYVNRDLK
jgi:hypothetical protein